MVATGTTAHNSGKTSAKSDVCCDSLIGYATTEFSSGLKGGQKSKAVKWDVGVKCSRPALVYQSPLIGPCTESKTGCASTGQKVGRCSEGGATRDINSGATDHGADVGSIEGWDAMQKLGIFEKGLHIALLTSTMP